MLMNKTWYLDERIFIMNFMYILGILQFKEFYVYFRNFTILGILCKFLGILCKF